MSIESTPFGGVKLTGEDARKFRNQVRYGRPKRAAVEAIRRGVELAEQIAEQGFVRIASADTRPKGGDALAAPSVTSGAVPEGQTPSPSPSPAAGR